MGLQLFTIACVGVMAASAAADKPSESWARYWPQWRGPLITGVAPHGDPPTEWSESENVRWKVEIPGFGHATPIVWEDRIYVQTAAKSDREAKAAEGAKQPAPPERRGRRGPMGGETPAHIHEFKMLAIDRATGETVWERTLREALPHEGGHQDASFASNSPITDGEHIIAYFGSRGVYCLDMKGRPVWERDLGEMRTRRGFGEGSSPALYGDTAVINWDHEGQSFIVALDKTTGKTKWKLDRDEPTSWATPLVVNVDGRPQVVTSASNRIRSYDLSSGELKWQCSGMTLNTIPSPLEWNGLLYFASGFRGNALMAVRYAEASGDITGTNAVAWTYEEKNTPYVPSPALHDGLLYFLDGNRAMLSCVDARTGEPRYTNQRLEGMQGVYASPVAAGDRVYVAGRGGKTAVIQSGPEFRLIAMNSLDDGFTASPVIVDDALLLRGRSHLYCIAQD
jgi:outer membrane protein assembly factor BamB